MALLFLTGEGLIYPEDIGSLIDRLNKNKHYEKGR